MRIGEASTASGVPERMIRHYEKLGLVPPASRTGGGYRDYGEDDVRRLRFIGLAREVGIAMDVIVEVMGVWDDPHGSGDELRRFGVVLDDRSRAAAELNEELGRLLDGTRAS